MASHGGRIAQSPIAFMEYIQYRLARFAVELNPSSQLMPGDEEGVEHSCTHI